MKPSNPNERARARDRDDSREADDTVQETPSTDLQPEDAGTPESGNRGHGTAAEAAMKQTSKTGRESGSKR